MKKIENIIFLGIIVLIMLGGFVKPIILPSEINYYENRPSNLLPKFSLKSIFEKTYQDNFEKALADQIPLSTTMKMFQKNAGVYTNVTYSRLIEDGYVNISGFLLKEGYLLYQPSSYKTMKSYLDIKIPNINKIVKDNPKIDFYLYYIEKDNDINFINNEKVGMYEYIIENIDKRIKYDNFEVKNFDSFKKYFYKTDHHWNHRGSYQGYIEVVRLLGYEPIAKEKEVDINIIWSGSKSRAIGGDLVFNEDFKAYTYDLPQHKTYINNIEVKSYGSQQEYINGERKTISYGSFYGFDDGLLLFDYNDSKKENLLIIGESFDNAINEVLASHFNKTYNVDLRAYKMDIGEEFNLKKFIKDKKIDKVLLIGNIGFYISKDFLIEN